MTRRLAAILVADVAGYSRLMHENEEATHGRFTRAMTGTIEPAVAEHGGRMVKSTGDGFLAEFNSAVEAVGCALQFQGGLRAADAEGAEANRLEFRAGVHLGEVIVEARDVYGDGVNIAARLSGLAEPGGIVISEPVHENVRGRLACEFEDLGARQVKNIARPLRLFRVLPAPARGEAAAAARRGSAADQPSIAVLPLQNLSGDPEQDNFADGIVEDLTAALSRFHALSVIARKSAFAYKGRDLDVRQVGRELGARYVIEGSLRKLGNRLRISVQAVQAETGAHLWAERYEYETRDLFATQDETTAGIVTALVPAIERAEIERVRRKPAASLDAYDVYLRALAAQRMPTRKSNEEARALVRQALARDPYFVPALVLADACVASAVANGWLAEEALAGLLDQARLAVELAPEDAEALATLALRVAAMTGDADQAVLLAGRAIDANPHSASVWSRGGYACLYAGQPEQALHRFECAEQLGADDDRTWSGIGYALLALGRDDAAQEAARRAAHHNPGSTDACRILAAALALTDRVEDAAPVLWRLLELDPSCSIQTVRRRFGVAEGAGARLLQGLRRAGLAEASIRPVAETDEPEEEDTSTVLIRPVLGRDELRRVLRIAQPDEPEREITIGALPLVVGRGADADVKVADHKVSRAHCRIVLTEGEVTVTDLDSTNGTFVDGRRIAGTTILDPGAVLEIGTCRLEYHAEEPADPDGTIGMTVHPDPSARGRRFGTPE